MSECAGVSDRGGSLTNALTFDHLSRDSHQGFHCNHKCLQLCTYHVTIGDREPRTIPTKTFLIGWYFLGDGAQIVGTKEKRKIRTTPSFALAMLIVNFVGVVRGFRGLKPYMTILSFKSSKL